MTQLVHARVTTPIGEMVALASDRGLCALEFAGPKRRARLDKRLGRWFPSHTISEGNAPAIVQARRWLEQYFGGVRPDIDVALDMPGAPFEQRVWKALLGIPLGHTTSYGAIAKTLGDAGASRAVGLANGANPIAIIVPCHRVIGSDGSLTGYGGGLDRKTWLIDHERRWRTGTLF